MLNSVTNQVKRNDKNQSVGLKIWKTIVLFLVGWLGLKTVAFGIEVIRCLSFGAELSDVIAFLTTEDKQFLTQEIVNALGTSEANMVINAATYIILFVTLICVINVDFKQLFKSFNSKWAIPAALIGLAAILSFNRFYSTIVSFLHQISDNENEQAIDSIIVVYPMLSLLIFGIIGPIVEELTYRVGLFETLKKATKSKTASYVITMLFFAFIHFAFESVATFIVTGIPNDMINELLNLPLYLSAAFAFTFLYDKIGLAGSLYCHIFNNLLSIGLTILLTLL